MHADVSAVCEFGNAGLHGSSHYVSRTYRAAAGQGSSHSMAVLPGQQEAGLLAASAEALSSAGETR